MDKMNNMDKFFELAFINYTNDDDGDVMARKIDDLFKPFTDRLRKLLAPEIVSELEENLIDCYVATTNIAGVEGMKLAIGIINGDIKLSL